MEAAKRGRKGSAVAQAEDGPTSSQQTAVTANNPKPNRVRVCGRSASWYACGTPKASPCLGMCCWVRVVGTSHVVAADGYHGQESKPNRVRA